MRDVIQKVIATEAEASRMVQSARTEAGNLLADARIQAGSLVDQARNDAQVDAGKIVAAAELQAEQEKAGRRTLAADEIEKSVNLEETRVQRAVEATLRCVLGLG